MSRKQRLKALSLYTIMDREDYIYAVQRCNESFIESLGDGMLLREYVRAPVDSNFAHRGKPIGIAIVFQYMGNLYASASCCRPGDTFDRHIGFFYATQKHGKEFVKIVGSQYNFSNLPRRSHETVLRLIDRAKERLNGR